MTYTPGIWTIVPSSSTTVQGGKRVVASCGGYSDNQKREETHLENEANARLIALAPELLEALEWSMRIIESILTGAPEISQLEGYDCLEAGNSILNKIVVA